MNQVLKALLPEWLVRLKRNVQLRAIRRHFGRLLPRDAFSEIYRQRLWGTSETCPYCSGSGSRGNAAQEYVQFVRSFIYEHHIASVLDLGCGDFFIASQFAPLVNSYVGVDVVPDLIDYLASTYGREGIRFECLDITSDPLPPAELCLIRQVFQHLSNDQIQRTLQKLAAFRYVLITEHQPSGLRPVVPNRDKPNGPDTRLMDDSGVFLDQPPYCLSVQEVLSVPADHCLIAEGEVIRTFLISNDGDIKDTNP